MPMNSTDLCAALGMMGLLRPEPPKGAAATVAQTVGHPKREG